MAAHGSGGERTRHAGSAAERQVLDLARKAPFSPSLARPRCGGGDGNGISETRSIWMAFAAGKISMERCFLPCISVHILPRPAREIGPVWNIPMENGSGV